MTTSNAEVLLSDARVPETLRANLKLFLRCLRRVLREYDANLLAVFDDLLGLMFVANRGNEDPKGSSEACARLPRFFTWQTFARNAIATTRFTRLRDEKSPPQMATPQTS